MKHFKMKSRKLGCIGEVCCVKRGEEVGILDEVLEHLMDLSCLHWLCATFEAPTKYISFTLLHSFLGFVCTVGAGGLGCFFCESHGNGMEPM